MVNRQQTDGSGKDQFAAKRKAMVDLQIKNRGVEDPRLLSVMEEIPRHIFVPSSFREKAYDDEPLPIGMNQTISQPYIVAYMVDQLKLTGEEKVLEIGTGSGYQTAVLANLSLEVYTLEIIPELSLKAQEVIKKLDYHNVLFKVGDGHEGWPENAPYDGIIVSAAPDQIPMTLIEQLGEGGRMIIPVGGDRQELIVLKKANEHVEKVKKIPVRFVPMTGSDTSGQKDYPC